MTEYTTTTRYLVFKLIKVIVFGKYTQFDVCNILQKGWERGKKMLGKWWHAQKKKQLRFSALWEIVWENPRPTVHECFLPCNCKDFGDFTIRESSKNHQSENHQKIERICGNLCTQGARPHTKNLRHSGMDIITWAREHFWTPLSLNTGCRCVSKCKWRLQSHLLASSRSSAHSSERDCGLTSQR